jgi:nephrocystin-3
MPDKSRVVRVFVSSTFRDMQEERERLVKFVFPELRRRCRERQVEFVEVDLRWGVTEEQAEQGEVLPICLAEIENCRPYFIGLLGERYGYVPKHIDPELIDIQPWLAEHREHSITALEILHGALNDPGMAGRAYIYFRGPAHLARIPREKQADFAPENPAARGKLDVLKSRIRQSGLQVREDYPDPETVGKWIQEDLWQAIDQEYPAGSELHPLDREALDHEAFAESRAGVYIGRQEYFDRLDAHVKSDEPPLVLLGESGVGKSALLANWLRHYREDHPDTFLLLHFVGSTAQSADYVAILARIMGEIKRRFKVMEDLPAAPDKLREAFPSWLAMAAAQARIVLVLDALNQLEDRDNAPDLGWVPGYFPPNIRVILSTLPGRSLEALKKRQWSTVEVEALRPEECRELSVKYLGHYRKTLDASQLERIAVAPQTANPLYLRTLLEELRVFGVHERLDQRITHYLAAPTVPDLYQKVLERLEEDYEKKRPGLVEDAMSLLWAARRGLYESELLELLGSPANPLPRLSWSPLHLAMQESLVDRSALLGFFHDYLRQAVHERYLTTQAQERAQHLRIADYFSSRELDQRQVDELPWQLEEAQEWGRLKECLCDMEIFHMFMIKSRQYEVTGYLLALGERHDMVDSYKIALKRYERSRPSEESLAAKFHDVASFLYLNARYDGAKEFSRNALTLRERALGRAHPDTAQSLSHLAKLYFLQSRLDEAEILFKRSLNTLRKALGSNHPAVAKTLNELAKLHYVKRKYLKAGAGFKHCLKIRKRILGTNHPDVAQSLIDLGRLYWIQGVYEKSAPLYHSSLAIREKAFGPEHPDVAKCLNNIGTLYYCQGDYSKAEPKCQRALAIREKMLGPEHPDVADSLNDLALVYTATGALDKAEQLFQASLSIYEKVMNPNQLYIGTVMSNLAFLYRAQGIYEKAEPLYRRALHIYEKALGAEHPDTASSLINLALLLRDMGTREEAAPLFRRLLAVQEGSIDQTGSITREILNILAICHNELAFHTEVPARNWEQAAYHYHRAIECFSRVPDRIQVTNAELNLQTMFWLSGQQVDLARVRELTEILEEAGDPRVEKGRRLLKELS